MTAAAPFSLHSALSCQISLPHRNNNFLQQNYHHHQIFSDLPRFPGVIPAPGNDERWPVVLNGNPILDCILYSNKENVFNSRVSCRNGNNLQISGQLVWNCINIVVCQSKNHVDLTFIFSAWLYIELDQIDPLGVELL